MHGTGAFHIQHQSPAQQPAAPSRRRRDVCDRKAQRSAAIYSRGIPANALESGASLAALGGMGAATQEDRGPLMALDECTPLARLRPSSAAPAKPLDITTTILRIASGAGGLSGALQLDWPRSSHKTTLDGAATEQTLMAVCADCHSSTQLTNRALHNARGLNDEASRA